MEVGSNRDSADGLRMLHTFRSPNTERSRSGADAKVVLRLELRLSTRLKLIF